MVQMQFLVKDLDESEKIDTDLEFIGIDTEQVHYLNRDSQSVADHDIHAASIFEERDIVHSGIRGALIGLIVGLFLSGVTFFLQPFGWQPELYNIVLITFLFVGFFTWIGGLFGIGHENYKIADFHQYLIKGNSLLMIYLRTMDEQKVLKMMSEKHPKVTYLATKEAIDNPFTSAKLIEID